MRLAATALFRRCSLYLIGDFFHAHAADATLAWVFKWDANVGVSAAFCFASENNYH
jgi:hypothetical protein